MFQEKKRLIGRFLLTLFAAAVIAGAGIIGCGPKKSDSEAKAPDSAEQEKIMKDMKDLAPKDE